MRYKQSTNELKKILKQAEDEILKYPAKCKEREKIAIFIEQLQTRIINHAKF